MHRFIHPAVAALALGAADTAVVAQCDPHLALHGHTSFVEFGQDVEGMGDLDGDGVGDLVVGAPGDHAGGLKRGRVSLMSGATGDPILHVIGDADDSWMGEAVANVGDVNADGLNDFAAFSYAYEIDGENAGKMWVFSGADGSLIHEMPGRLWDRLFNEAVADGLGDVDGDGFGDFLLGLPASRVDDRLTRQGQALLLSGADLSVIWSIVGDGSFREMGRCVEGIDDLDGDAVPDALITEEGLGFGRALLVSGAEGTVIREYRGKTISTGFGHSAATLPDLNGDGFIEVIVGAPWTSVPVNNAGAAYLISGADGTYLRTWSNNRTSYLGYSVANPGDIDRDGLDDYAVGEWGGSFAGTVDVYSGADGSPICTVSEEGGDDFFSEALAGVGDVTGDGLDDFAAGCPWCDVGGESSGTLYVYAGGCRFSLDVGPLNFGEPARVGRVVRARQRQRLHRLQPHRRRPHLHPAAGR